MSRPTASLDLGVVILNWNGARDTIECIKSIYSQPSIPSHVVLVDNGSTHGTVPQVKSWLDGQTTKPAGFTLIENGKNLGFAAGNNVGVRHLMQEGVKYVMLLNNDTVVAENAFSKLVDAMGRMPEAQTMVPQIRYWSAPDRIWSCGGVWSWSNSPRYCYAEQDASVVAGKAPFPVSFVTGCALMVRTDWFAANGLLSERFFFGEEDVEFSWRMRRSGPKTMACCPAAVIYHKVGVSITRMLEGSKLPGIYCHYLNRLILLKMMWGKGVRWYAWRVGVLAYFARTLVSKLGFSPLATTRVLRDLARDSSEKDSVTADFFFWLMKEKFSRVTGA